MHNVYVFASSPTLLINYIVILSPFEDIIRPRFVHVLNPQMRNRFQSLHNKVIDYFSVVPFDIMRVFSRCVT